MLCAVLSPNDSEFFAKANREIVTIATRPVVSHDQNQPSLPQVHALNCLKDVMTNSRFRTSIEPYLGGMLELSAKSLSSSTWAIRNCGLMLLRACMNRLDSRGPDSSTDPMGSNGTTTTGTLPLTVAVELLSRIENVEDPMLQSELIFAGLDLAKQVGPTSLDQETLNPLIRKQLGNPVWAVRDHAARLLASRTVTNDLTEDVFGMDLSQTGTSANLLHGTLLFFGYVIAEIGQNTSHENTAGLMSFLQGFVDRSTALFRLECSPYTKAAMFDVINDVLLYSTGVVGYPLQWPRELLDDLSVISSRLDKTSNSFYRQRLLFYQMLCLLLNNQSRSNDPQSVSDAMVNELVRDPDIARFVIDGIGRRPLQPIPSMVDLFVKIVPATKAADVRASSMMVLVAHLEREMDELSDAQVMLLEEAIDQSSARGREFGNASLRLEGHLLRKRLSRHNNDISEITNAKAKGWLFSICVASGDQLDSLTRLNAAVAMEHCGPKIVLRANKTKISGWEEFTIHVLSLVYDQLNDDDEDVREVAQRTALMIIHEQRRGLRSSLSLCALGARELILDLLVKQFRTCSALSKLALQRIVGSKFIGLQEPDAALHSSFSDGVSDRLDNIQTSMNDLFAEEKQNLYIDEVNEVNKWSNVLDCCDLQSLEVKWRVAASKWCSEGLGALVSLLQTNRQADCKAMMKLHPMHSTYNADILLLFTRAVKLATILEGMDELTDITDTGASTQVDVLRQKLLQMRSVCLDTRVHRRVQALFTVTPGSGHT
jgi:Putative death-receptor fusion protein (DUF2428)